MNRRLLLCFTAVCVLGAFPFAGCNKNVSDTPDKTVDKVKEDKGSCQVQRIIIPASLRVATNRVRPLRYIAQNIPYKTSHVSNIAAGVADTLDFSYDKSGNPLSVIHRMDIGDNSLFTYDKKGRLSEYINIFPSNTAGDYWHRYAYDGKKGDQIIADTAFRDFTSSNGKLLSYNDIDLTTFQYDDYGRIRQSTEYVLGNTIVRQYTYDAQGNLVHPGGTFDNKVNIHLTNKTWMFVDRDYSLNNPVDNGSYAYNSVGLPISIITNSSSVTAGFQFIVIGYPFNISNDLIGYDCSKK
ncbi:MAG TPA: hypothetical protein VL832_16735 [Puia sp.]|nr:hypothetical protein [Puia sp.]